MTSFTIIGTSTAPQTLQNLETGVIGPNGFLYSTAPCIELVGLNNLLVQGAVAGTGDTAILADVAARATASSMFVTSGGSIWGVLYAINLEVGEFSGFGYGGVSLDNAGSVSAGSSAVLLKANNLTDAKFAIRNTGTIQSNLAAVDLRADLGIMDITNTGRIESFSGPAITLTSSLGARIVNDGVISTGSDAWAIQITGTGDDVLRNSGRIVGNVELGAGNDTMDGRGGTILGVVNSGLGDDLIYWGTGPLRVVETQTGGQDTVVAQGNATLGDWIEVLELSGTDDLTGVGNGLANRITGNAGDNRLLGAAGNDTLIGGLGDDRLGGGAGVDLADYSAATDGIVANLATGLAEGADIGSDSLVHVEAVLGGAGADLLTGSAGDNTLIGGLGKDTIRGGNGDDVLQGDRGADDLVGGRRADRFVYVSASDSQSLLGVDRISDFKAEDVIDLSAIDANTGVLLNQVFTWIGTAAFSAAGQLRYGQDTLAGQTSVQGDLNGDGVQDFQITLSGLVTLTAGDFVL